MCIDACSITNDLWMSLMMIRNDQQEHTMNMLMVAKIKDIFWNEAVTRADGVKLQEGRLLPV